MILPGDPPLCTQSMVQYLQSKALGHFSDSMVKRHSGLVFCTSSFLVLHPTLQVFIVRKNRVLLNLFRFQKAQLLLLTLSVGEAG